MKRKLNRGWGALFFALIFAAAIAVVMLLWNWLIPDITGWAAINYLQAAGLIVLMRLLFGGMSKPWHMWHGRHHKMHGHLFDEVKDMSPEERRNYIRNRIMRERFGHDSGEN